MIADEKQRLKWKLCFSETLSNASPFRRLSFPPSNLYDTMERRDYKSSDYVIILVWETFLED